MDSDSDELAKRNSVGYGNPPVHSRFQPGKSGNPNGRPRGSLNFDTIFRRSVREIVVINENGKRKRVTKLEAAVKQLANKAASGEFRAITQVIGNTLSVEQRAAAEMTPTEPINEFDQKVLDNLLKRYSQS